MTLKFDHTKKWYRTDLKEEAFDYLDKMEIFFDKTSKCSSYWKWVLISLHGTLYHLMLFALRNTDGSGVWRKEIKTASGRMDFAREDEMYLIGFMEAFKRIKDERKMFGYTNSKALISSKKLDTLMKDLNQWRNNFVHYKPKGRSIEIEIFRDILEQTLSVIKFIVNDCGRVILDREEVDNSNKIIKKIGKRVFQVKIKLS